MSVRSFHRVSPLLASLAVACGAVGPPAASSGARDGCPWSGRAPRELLAGRYTANMISRGDNRPGVDLVGQRLDALSILLHYRVRPDAIQHELGWTAGEYEAHLQALVDEGLAKRDPVCGALPTAMVISMSDGQRLFELVEPAAKEIAAAIAVHVPELRRQFVTLPGARAVSFDQASFLILSNVLLDNGQIGSVEQAFLGTERTARNGKHYYEAFLEQAPGSGIEAFGIYGNAVHPYGNVMLGLYGNARSGKNFATLTATQLAQDFAMPAGEDENAFKTALANELARSALDASPAPHQHGFETLGLMNGRQVLVPVFQAADLELIASMAKLFLPDLLKILEHHRPAFEAAYRASPYRDEISFAEYFMWTYHFLYTRATDLLAKHGTIQIPVGGVATYLVQP